MKNIFAALAGLLSISLAHADICSDLHTIQTHAADHFDGWKRESLEGRTAAGKQYASSFQLDRADSCTIGGDSASYSCVWRFASPADLGRAYQKMIDDVKACGALGKELPGIVRDDPKEREQGSLRQTLAVTGFDFADVESTVLIGRMQITGNHPGLSRNELKMTFSRSPAAR